MAGGFAISRAGASCPPNNGRERWLIGEDVFEVDTDLGFEVCAPVAVTSLLEDFAAIVFEVGFLPLAVGAEEDVVGDQGSSSSKEFGAALDVGMGVPPLLDGAAPCAEHLGVVAKVLETLVGLEGTAYAAEAAFGVEGAFAVVVEGVALDVAVGDEGGYVFVGPGENGEDDVDVVVSLRLSHIAGFASFALLAFTFLFLLSAIHSANYRIIF